MAIALRRISVLLAISLLVASVAAFGLFAWPQWSRSRSAATWPIVEGTVVRCEVVAGPSGNRRGGGPMYELDLLVRYEVDGVTLVTDREGFVPVRSSDPTWYRERAREIRAGSTVPVRYDPADPGFAVLRAEGGWISLVLPGALLVMSIVVALVARFAKPPPLLDAVEIPPRLRRVGAGLLGLFGFGFLTIGLVSLVIGLGRLRTLDEAASWTVREATVVRSEWIFASNGATAGAKPSLVYRYAIDGIERESGELAPVPVVDASTLGWNRRILAWRPGERVAVRVDPADPTRSALELPGFGLDRSGLVLAAAFTGLGLIGFVRAIRLLRSARRDLAS